MILLQWLRRSTMKTNRAKLPLNAQNMLMIITIIRHSTHINHFKGFQQTLSPRPSCCCSKHRIDFNPFQVIKTNETNHSSCANFKLHSTISTLLIFATYESHIQLLIKMSWQKQSTSTVFLIKKLFIHINNYVIVRTVRCYNAIVKCTKTSLPSSTR